MSIVTKPSNFKCFQFQIKKFCPNTPILLVGCKNDVRFIYKDEKYLNYCRERSPLVRYDNPLNLLITMELFLHNDLFISNYGIQLFTQIIYILLT